MLLLELVGLLLGRKWLPVLELPLVGHSQLVLLSLCKTLFFLHLSFPVLARENLDSLGQSGPQTSHDTSNVVLFDSLFLLSILTLHPTYLP